MVINQYWLHHLLIYVRSRGKYTDKKTNNHCKWHIRFARYRTFLLSYDPTFDMKLKEMVHHQPTDHISYSTR